MNRVDVPGAGNETLPAARRGSIRQLAYVTNSERFNDTIDFWRTAIGAGPFFLLNLELEDQTFRGVPTESRRAAALTFHGGAQIEIIAPKNQEPSPHVEWLERYSQIPSSGLFHHFLIDTWDFAGTIAGLRRVGCADGLAGRFPDGRQIAFLDGSGQFGCYVEVVETNDGAQQVNQAMRDVCKHWDGTRPIRSYDELTANVPGIRTRVGS